MDFPTQTNTYCPHCRKHTLHKIKALSKGRPRSLAAGNVRHEEKLRGYVGKVAGEKSVRKQGKRQAIVLVCDACKKKHVRTIGTRTKKKLEFKS